MAAHLPDSRTAGAFEARALRAELLAGEAQAAREALLFAAGLFRAQGAVAAELERLHVEEALTGELARDLERALSRLLGIASFAVESAPVLLADAARIRLADDELSAMARLWTYWKGQRTQLHDYLSRAMLRPYVETLRALRIAPARWHRRARCPFCGGAPIVGCRRGAGWGDGAARFLSCALCGLEWPLTRILCPACFERDPRKLPAFASPDHPLVRIEVCETCQRYVKSLDLSQDARPEPEVDDLTSLPLDLWAAEQGFERLEPGLAGV